MSIGTTIIEEEMAAAATAAATGATTTARQRLRRPEWVSESKTEKKNQHRNARAATAADDGRRFERTANGRAPPRSRARRRIARNGRVCVCMCTPCVSYVCVCTYAPMPRPVRSRARVRATRHRRRYRVQSDPRAYISPPPVGIRFVFQNYAEIPLSTVPYMWGWDNLPRNFIGSVNFS